MKYSKNIKIDSEKVRQFSEELRDLSLKSITTNHGRYEKYDSVVLHTLPRKRSKQIAMNFFSENICKHIKGISFTDVKHVGPHKHITDNCALNFYLECNNEYTTFWEGAETPDNEVVSDNGNGYYMLKIEELLPVEQFQAKNNEVWLIDTTKPHSVSSVSCLSVHEHSKANITTFLEKYTNSEEKSRKLLQVFFEDSLSFKNVKEMFSET
jgi:hypothetical protein